MVDQNKNLELENPILEGPTLKDISPEQMANISVVMLCLYDYK